MKQRNTLETLIFESGLTQKAFAEKVGVKVRTLEAQLQKKTIKLDLAFKYAVILGVKRIKGFEAGTYIDFEF